MLRILEKAMAVLIAAISINPVFAQSNFTWQNQSLGGGGFCQEIRFDPYHLIGNPFGTPHLYLATDVSGLFRSSDLGDSWERVWDPAASTETDVPDANLTTTAFNVPNTRIIIGSGEGIHYGPAAGGNWLAANMPERGDPGFAAMKAEDGRYPWIGIIREYPLNTNFMLAGIGDLREKPVTQFGLGTLLRSSDGGQNWDAVTIDGAEPDEIVYDIDYATCSDNNAIHVFVTTGFAKTDKDAPFTYKGGVYYSNNMFTPAFGNGQQVSFVKITTNPGGNPIKNPVSLISLHNSAAPNPIQAGSPVYVWVVSYTDKNVDGGGVYRALTNLTALSDLLAESPQSQATSLNQPNWFLKHAGRRLGRLAAKSSCTRTAFELFLGKELEQRIYLAVTNNTLASGTNVFREIVSPDLVSPFGANDVGYRELDSEGNSPLKFGSLDINPEDPHAHPTVYGCWGYGPLKAPGGGAVEAQGPGDGTFPLFQFDSPRYYQQIFTTKAGTDTNGDDAYVSRGMDEVFFNGQQAVFKPDNANVVLVGCGDNGLLRTANINDNPVKWSQRRLATSQWYQDGSGNTLNQFIYHLAFHPQNANTVIASAGTRNVRPNDVGQGGLLKSNLAGAGGPEDWGIIAGGPSVVGGGTFAGLPDAMIQAFVFDVKVGFEDGVFVTARNNGIYYGKINAAGNVTQNFQRIEEADLLAKIPLQRPAGENWDVQHSYSKMMFDPDNADVLYVARHWPGGGVFRIRLNSARISSDLIATDGVDEVIDGRIIGNAGINIIKSIVGNEASDVINLFVTPGVSGYVFAGVTCGHRADDANDNNYSGGLIRWGKNDDAGVYQWKIGGPGGAPSKTIAIGGLAQDPLNSNTILATTYRFSLRANRLTSSNKYYGEDNYKLMNLWRSIDGGETFYSLSNSTTQHQWPDAVTMAFFPNNPDKIIMPTHGNGIWIGAYNGPPRKMVMPLDSTQSGPRLPQRFTLHLNYPNPFNPSTMIKFDLPKAIQVKLGIHDVLGRQVRLLVDGELEAGYHAKAWDGNDDKGAAVTSGLYFYRLHTSDFTQVHKMTLLR